MVADGKEFSSSAGDLGSIPGLGRSLGEGNGWLTTPVFLSGEFHGQTSLVAYSPWDCKESDMTEQLPLFSTFHPCTCRIVVPSLCL